MPRSAPLCHLPGPLVMCYCSMVPTKLPKPGSYPGYFSVGAKYLKANKLSPALVGLFHYA
jgi:hypothetical protein